MNENIGKDQTKFTMECSQDEMVFLDTIIVVAPITDEKVGITSDMCFEKMDTHQYRSPSSCHAKTHIKNIRTKVANRIIKNYSDNVINDVTYRKRLTDRIKSISHEIWTQ